MRTLCAVAMLSTVVVLSACKSETSTSQPVAQEVGQATPHKHDDHGEAEDAPAPSDAKNPVKHEMQLLTVAMHNSLDAIANDELTRIPGEIAKVHPAKVATEEAVKAGTYRPPKNADRLAAFTVMDEAFHDDLRTLLGAAKANDRPAAAAAYGKLVQGCVGCHQTFRNP